ncbi:hypothetical protein ACQZ44_16470 [Agrobacterium vitis]
MIEQATQNKGRLVWLSIDKNVERYVVLTEDGREIPDPVLGPRVRNALVGIRRFFSDNGLLTVPKVNDQGGSFDGDLFEFDFTEDGLEMLRRGAERWFDSKAAQKNPPDFKSLEKILAAIKSDRD